MDQAGSCPRSVRLAGPDHDDEPWPEPTFAPTPGIATAGGRRPAARQTVRGKLYAAGTGAGFSIGTPIMLPYSVQEPS
jgi:hypothetical protein